MRALGEAAGEAGVSIRLYVSGFSELGDTLRAEATTSLEDAQAPPLIPSPPPLLLLLMLLLLQQQLLLLLLLLLYCHHTITIMIKLMITIRRGVTRRR